MTCDECGKTWVTPPEINAPFPTYCVECGGEAREQKERLEMAGKLPSYRYPKGTLNPKRLPR